MVSGGEVWYRWTVGLKAAVDTRASTFDTVLAVHAGEALAPHPPWRRRLHLPASASPHGATHRVAVDGFRCATPTTAPTLGRRSPCRNRCGALRTGVG